jgi:hypothetical protein
LYLLAAARVSCATLGACGAGVSDGCHRALRAARAVPFRCRGAAPAARLFGGERRQRNGPTRGGVRGQVRNRHRGCRYCRGYCCSCSCCCRFCERRRCSAGHNDTRSSGAKREPCVGRGQPQPRRSRGGGPGSEPCSRSGDARAALSGEAAEQRALVRAGAPRRCAGFARRRMAGGGVGARVSGPVRSHGRAGSPKWQYRSRRFPYMPFEYVSFVCGGVAVF